MHQYAVDPDDRTAILFYLAGLAVAGSWAVHALLAYWHVDVPWWIDAPTPLLIYGIVYRAFDRIGWRQGIVRRIGIIGIPNLNGVWKGVLLSSFDDQATEHRVTLVVVQTWTRISVELQAGQSRSHSHIAGIANGIGSEPMLSYEYVNEPEAGAVPGMHMHRGTAWLRINQRQLTLDGEYYTGRGRQTYGRMTFNRIDQR